MGVKFDSTQLYAQLCAIQLQYIQDLHSNEVFISEETITFVKFLNYILAVMKCWRINSRILSTNVISQVKFEYLITHLEHLMLTEH